MDDERTRVAELNDRIDELLEANNEATGALKAADEVNGKLSRELDEERKARAAAVEELLELRGRREVFLGQWGWLKRVFEVEEETEAGWAEALRCRLEIVRLERNTATRAEVAARQEAQLALTRLEVVLRASRKLIGHLKGSEASAFRHFVEKVDAMTIGKGGALLDEVRQFFVDLLEVTRGRNCDVEVLLRERPLLSALLRKEP